MYRTYYRIHTYSKEKSLIKKVSPITQITPITPSWEEKIYISHVSPVCYEYHTYHCDSDITNYKLQITNYDITLITCITHITLITHITHIMHTTHITHFTHNL